jgi:hypothetical protein
LDKKYRIVPAKIQHSPYLPFQMPLVALENQTKNFRAVMNPIQFINRGLLQKTLATSGSTLKVYKGRRTASARRTRSRSTRTCSHSLKRKHPMHPSL